MDALNLNQPPLYIKASAVMVSIIITAMLYTMMDLSHQNIIAKPTQTIPIPPSVILTTPEITPSTSVSDTEPSETPLPSLMPQPTHPNLELQPLDLGLKLNLNSVTMIQPSMKEFSQHIENSLNIESQTKTLFSFEELSQPPRYLSLPELHYPSELRRRGIREGEVSMLIVINEKGKAKVLEVLSSTHLRFNAEAIRLVEQASFTIPMKDGQPTRTKGKWTLKIKDQP